MAKDNLDINKFIEQGTQNMRLADLANRGINKVKVLDETALRDLIEQAVDKVINSSSEEERARIAEQSRAQLQRFIKERNEFMTQRDMLEIGKKDLVTQIEALQNEVKAHRDLQEQNEANFQNQLKPIVDRQKKAEADLEALREENDKIAEAYEKAEADVKRLEAEVGDAREGSEVELHNLKVELEEAQAKVGALEQERDEARKEAGEVAGLQKERDEARQQAEKVAGLEKERDEALRKLEEAADEVKAAEMRAKAAESKADEGAEDKKSLDDALEEVDRLTTKLDEKDGRIAELEAEIERLKAEIGRLKKELEEARSQSDNNQAQADTAFEKAREQIASLTAAVAAAKAGGEGREKAEAEAKKAREDLRKYQEQTKGQMDELEKRANDAEMEVAQLRDKAAKAAAPFAADHVSKAEPVKQEEPPPPAPPAEPKEEEAIPEPQTSMPTVAPRVSGESAGKLLAEGSVAVGKGLDIGTVNLVAAENNENGEVLLRKKRNAFIDVPQDTHTRSMLKRLKVPYVVQGRRLYVLGEAAFELANVLNKNTRRPMKDGLISPKEQDALPIMRLLISSILGEPRVKKEVCFYSVPGDPVDSDLSVVYHRDLFDAALKSLGYKPSHIIEGHAVTFAELAEDDFTGIGISCGGGMFNICVAYKSMPALFFSTSKSGDWIDNSVAQALGIKTSKAALLKEEGIDLMDPKDRYQDAIAIYYRKLIKDNLDQIKNHFEAAETMPSFPDPISIVFSGGTALAGGFIELARDVFKDLDFPIDVKEIRLAKDPLNSTAKGCLTAAMLEMAQQGAS